MKTSQFSVEQIIAMLKQAEAGVGVPDLCRQHGIEVAPSPPAARVVRVLERVLGERGAPERITVDNGPECISRAVDAWACQRNITLDFIQPGKPTQNAFIASFNGKFRDQCRDRHWFTSLDDAIATIAAYRRHDNAERPHSALGNRTPGGIPARPRSARLPWVSDTA